MILIVRYDRTGDKIITATTWRRYPTWLLLDQFERPIEMSRMASYPGALCADKLGPDWTAQTR